MSESLYSAIVLSIVLIAVGLGLTVHQGRNLFRDAFGAALMVAGFVCLLVSITLAVVL